MDTADFPRLGNRYLLRGEDTGGHFALLEHTMWEEGMRLALDPTGEPIRAADVTLGSAFHVIPEPLAELSHEEGYLEEKAKAWTGLPDGAIAAAFEVAGQPGHHDADG